MCYFQGKCNWFRKVAWLWSSETSPKPRNPFINFQDAVHRSSNNDLSSENSSSRSAEIWDSNATLVFILSNMLLFTYYLFWQPTEQISFFQPHIGQQETVTLAVHFQLVSSFLLLFSCFPCFKVVPGYLKLKFCLKSGTQAHPTYMSWQCRWLSLLELKEKNTEQHTKHDGGVPQIPR